MYAQRFSCIGASCEDSCCSGWKVTIDRKTFNAYRQTQNPRFEKRLNEKVKRIRSQASDRNYARMDMDEETGECPMMEEKLCGIQKELGEDKLSHTCSIYPRTTVDVGGYLQQALTLSCPEAARLALLSNDAFQFSESEITVRPETITQLNTRFGLNLDSMSEIRFFCIQIIRDERFQIWQKLAFLGLFCETLSAALKTGRQKFANVIEDMKGLMDSGQTEQLFNQMQPQYDIQAVTYIMLWRSKSNFGSSKSQRLINQSIIQGLGIDPTTGQVDEKNLAERYQSGIQKLSLALESAPQILENYILNELIHENFPFELDSPNEHYIRLITRFGMVRFMMAAQCNDDKALPSPETLAQTVQTFCRIYQHDSMFATNVNNCFHKSGWDSLDKIFRFIKT
jgi:lysine-N-methylase